MKLWDNYKEFVNVTECTIEQRLVSKNPYIALQEDNDIISNAVQTNSVSESEINVTGNNWKDLKHNSIRYYISMQELVLEPNKNIATQQSLQNQTRPNWNVLQRKIMRLIPLLQ